MQSDVEGVRSGGTRDKRGSRDKVFIDVGSPGLWPVCSLECSD